MDLNVKLVKYAGYFVITCSFLYKIIVGAKLYEVRRVSEINLASHHHLRATASATTIVMEHSNIRRVGSSMRHPLRSIAHSIKIDIPGTDGVTTANILERRSNLPSCPRSVKLYYRATCAFHILLAIKYIVLCVLDMSTSAHKNLGYIDCLLTGRTTLNPRVVGLYKFGSMCVFCFHSIHHLVLLNRTTPFRLHCLEFLLVSPATIREFSLSSDVMCSLLSYRSPSTCADSSHVRPNRTVRAWRRLATCTILWVGSVVGTYLVLIPYIWSHVTSMIVTRPGFEANYQPCLSWIAQQDEGSRWRLLIYDNLPTNYTGPDERWRHEFSVPLSEPWVDMNIYHIVRISWEVVENFIGQCHVWISYSIFPLIAILISIDTHYYCRQIQAEIMSIIREEREAAIAPTKMRATNGKQRIDNAQEMVLDLFALIRDYNSYSVHYVCFIISVWYLYSFICSSWLFMPYDRYRASTIESKMIQLAATALIMVILGSYASVQVACRHLYKSIATIATLQDVNAASRRRWLVILQHYSPAPLYCFSLFKATELSWMLALKLTAWLFSALLILSTFTVGGSRLTTLADAVAAPAHVDSDH